MQWGKVMISHEQIVSEVVDNAAADLDETVNMMVGLFVGIMELYAEVNDGITDGQQINIIGVNGSKCEREITIHALKKDGAGNVH